MHNELVHISCGFPVTSNMDMLAKSSVRNGFRFLGLPKNWRSGRLSKFEKCHLLEAFLRTGELNEQQTVLFTDAYDVLIIGHMELVCQKFYHSDLDIMFSAESNFWPPFERDSELKNSFDKIDSKWRYLNSGAFIGKVWALRDMLAECLPKGYADDQAMLQDFYYGHLYDPAIRVGIDFYPQLFVSLNDSEWDFTFRGSSVFKNLNRSKIVVLHANGSKNNLSTLRAVNEAIQNITDKNELVFHLPRVGRSFLSYNPDLRQFNVENTISSSTVFLLEITHRQALAFTAQNGCLTFLKDGRINCGAAKVGPWEKLIMWPEVVSAHQLPIASYFDGGAAESVIVDGILLGALPKINYAELIRIGTELIAQS